MKMNNKNSVTNSKKLHNPQMWVDIKPTEQELLCGGTGNNLITHELTHTLQQSSVPTGRIPLWIVS